MKYKKRLLVRIIFLAEVCLFAYGYGWGNHGIIDLYKRKKTNNVLAQQIAEERKELQELSAMITQWKEDPFYKERYARENLHMARKDEIVYTSK